jgi:hypothetical protein
MLFAARWLALDLPGLGPPLLSALVLGFQPPPAERQRVQYRLTLTDQPPLAGRARLQVGWGDCDG